LFSILGRLCFYVNANSQKFPQKMKNIAQFELSLQLKPKEIGAKPETNPHGTQKNPFRKRPMAPRVSQFDPPKIASGSNWFSRNPYFGPKDAQQACSSVPQRPNP